MRRGERAAFRRHEFIRIVRGDAFDQLALRRRAGCERGLLGLTAFERGFARVKTQPALRVLGVVTRETAFHQQRPDLASEVHRSRCVHRRDEQSCQCKQ